jgi:hypothetical protein
VLVVFISSVIGHSSLFVLKFRYFKFFSWIPPTNWGFRSDINLVFFNQIIGLKLLISSTKWWNAWENSSSICGLSYTCLIAKLRITRGPFTRNLRVNTKKKKKNLIFLALLWMLMKMASAVFLSNYYLQNNCCCFLSGLSLISLY